MIFMHVTTHLFAQLQTRVRPARTAFRISSNVPLHASIFFLLVFPEGFEMLCQPPRCGCEIHVLPLHLAGVLFAGNHYNCLAQKLVFIDDQTGRDAKSLAHIFKVGEDSFGGAH
jgi:hypothetical protein